MRRYWIAGLVAVLVGAFLFPTAASAKQPKVDLCHFDKDTGTYVLINIPQNAADKHIAKHGDVYPGTGGLDANCEPLPEVCYDLSAVEQVGVVISVRPDGPINTLGNFVVYETSDCSGPPQVFSDDDPIALIQASDESTALAIFWSLIDGSPSGGRVCGSLVGSVPPLPEITWLCVFIQT